MLSRITSWWCNLMKKWCIPNLYKLLCWIIRAMTNHHRHHTYWDMTILRNSINYIIVTLTFDLHSKYSFPGWRLMAVILCESFKVIELVLSEKPWTQKRLQTNTSTNRAKVNQETVDRRSSDMMKIEISEMKSDYALLLLRYYYSGHSGDVPAMKDRVSYQIRTGISMWMTWTHWQKCRWGLIFSLWSWYL